MKKIDRGLNLDTLKDDIIMWIKDYCVRYKIQSLIVGVSGGIDSALVSTLCAKTDINTYAILLPLHQKEEQTIRGEKHIDWLINNHTNVKKLKIDLSKTFESFKYSIPNDSHNELSFANSKSRLRMTTLYQIAQVKGGVVVGTGNKVEDFGIGFFTKYGDGGVDISPIADLYKSEVYAMAKVLGIMEEILTARPTDGLWDDDRDDETQIGATYDELEWVMEYIEHNPDFELNDLITFSNRELNVFKIYNELNNKNNHKMVATPIFKV
jgi:NAD+ synthase